MKFKWALNLLAVSCLVASPLVLAQETTKKDKSDEVRNITGCLGKGDSSGEYKVTASDGSTWEVKSKAVKLAPHVGHTVTVTGEDWHADVHEANEEAKEAMVADAKEHGHLNVTRVEIVSDCWK